MERKVEEAGKKGLAGRHCVPLYHYCVPRITLAAKGEVLNCCTCKPFWAVIFCCCFVTVWVNLKSATQTLSSKKVRTVIFFHADFCVDCPSHLQSGTMTLKFRSPLLGIHSQYEKII